MAGWSNSLLQAIDYAPSAACRCGHPLHTFRHAVWECPLTQPLRDKYGLLSLVDHSRFSASLAAGIPSMISADINTCPWDPSMPWTSNDFESFARAAGNQHRELMKYYHEATVAFDNIMGDEALKGLCAKLVVAKLRGPFGVAFPDPPPFALRGDGDGFVKVWPDGSGYFPQSGGLHLAGQAAPVRHMGDRQGGYMPQDLSMYCHFIQDGRSLNM